MDLFVVVALIGVGLLLAELLLSTGGVLAALGAAGLIAGGVLALTADADSSASDWAGPALITLGVLSIASFYFVTRKVLAAHREQPVRGGAGGADRRQRRGPHPTRPRGPGGDRGGDLAGAPGRRRGAVAAGG